MAQTRTRINAGAAKLTIFCVALFAVAAADASFGHGRIDHLRFNRSMALPGVVLPAGVYQFEIVNHGSGGDVVRISSREGTGVQLLRFTHRVRRPSGAAASSPVALGEAPEGQPTPIIAWYPTGADTGHQFLYW